MTEPNQDGYQAFTRAIVPLSQEQLTSMIDTPDEESCDFGPADDPRGLKAILLEQTDTEQQREFAKVLADMSATADLQARDHQCWFQIPTPKEYAQMEPYAFGCCPKCKEAGKPNHSVRVEVFHGNFGDSYHIKCWMCDWKLTVEPDMDNI